MQINTSSIKLMAKDRHFKEFNNFISMKERRGSLKSCGSIKSSISRLVEEK